MKIALYCSSIPEQPSVIDQQITLVRHFIRTPEDLYAIYVDAPDADVSFRQMIKDQKENRIQMIAAYCDLVFPEALLHFLSDPAVILKTLK